MTSRSEVAENLAFVDEQMQSAQKQGVELIQLPENFSQMPAQRSDQHIESPGKGEVQDFLSSKSRQYNMMVVAGTLPILEQGYDRPFARCLVFDRKGEQIACYDKVHLFDVDLPGKERYLESASYHAAELDGFDHDCGIHPNLTVVETPLGRLGLSICYDLRFPELFRVFAEQGVQIIMVPSAFTFNTGQAHWQTLLTARAIENQAYVIAAAQVGVHDNQRETWGHSMIIDPWGEVLSLFDETHMQCLEVERPGVGSTNRQTGLLIADLDLGKMEELSRSFPVLSHRRI
jgi:nitrilase